VNVASAIDRTRNADALWEASQLAHEMAPPDADFANRLRATSHAASVQAGALEYAITAGLTGKKPWPSAPQFARELGPTANRPGNKELWTKWDEVIKEWQGAAQGTNVAELARTFRLLAAYAEALAESVDQERGAVSGTTSDDNREAI
jgi:hypothetical protein